MRTTIEQDLAEGVVPCPISGPRTSNNPRARPRPAGVELMQPAHRDRFLTVRWNNRLTIGLGLPALIYVGIALATDVLSDGAAFVWLVLIGIVY